MKQCCLTAHTLGRIGDQMRILVISPSHEGDVTEVSCEWAKEMVGELTAKGEDVTAKEGVEAVKSELRADAVGRHKCTLFYGHGTFSGKKLIGQNGKAVVDESNAHDFAGQRFYAWACHAAKRLGRTLSDEPTRAIFVGFNDAISYVPGYERQFGRFANAGAREVVSGTKEDLTPASVYAAFEGVIVETANEYAAEGDSVKKLWLFHVLSTMNANREALRVLVPTNA